ncbi:MAG: DUF3135 domain-containing protein [Zoogloeaceae bacterium]|nr:DUF3135 domain-containing protein [Zoogloeaceae bacterium]
MLVAVSKGRTAAPAPFIARALLAEFDFDHWASLARDDPPAYFRARARAIRRFIDAHSPDQAERLEETQAKIDSVRVVCGNPRHASYQLAGMLEEQLRTLHDALDRLLALSEELTAALAAAPPHED